MDPRFVPFAWVALALPLLLLLQRWLHRHLRGLAYLLTGRMEWAVLLYALVLLPGVLLHELSHWLAARLLGVRTGTISLLPQMQKDGVLRLGYVEYYRSRNLDPVRESIIGVAPLLTGVAVVLLIGFRVFDLPGLGAALQTGAWQGLRPLLAHLFRAPDFLVWLYLIFSVSNAMMPSPSDRRAWPPFILLLTIAAVVLYLVDRQQVIIGGMVEPVATVFGHLGLAFSLAIAVDLAVIVVVYLLERLVSRLRGVELIYEQPGSPAGR